MAAADEFPTVSAQGVQKDEIRAERWRHDYSIQNDVVARIHNGQERREQGHIYNSFFSSLSQTAAWEERGQRSGYCVCCKPPSRLKSHHMSVRFSQRSVCLLGVFVRPVSDAVCAPCNFLFENNVAALSPINNAQRRTIIFPVSWMDTGNLGVNNPAPRCRSFVSIWQQACSACVNDSARLVCAANILCKWNVINKS